MFKQRNFALLSNKLAHFKFDAYYRSQKSCPSDDTASLIGMILSLTLLMGPGILPETTVGKHNLPCHLQMPTTALSCKTEAICEYGPEAPSCPVGQDSFKMVSKWKSVL